MASKPNQNALPPKEHNLFKSVVRFYETKQLKKALKTSDTILKRFPDHGETLAMKGLTLNALHKKAEATDLVRKGLRLDMRSHICWHVYGLLYRSERDYREAAKAYLNALKFDKDNQQILRDLALLQIQIRDYDGLEDTRRRLLTVRPNQRNNWIGFALSYHLHGNYATAISVLDTYQDTLKQSNDPEDRYEVSELLLYKNQILEESGDYNAALSHLSQNEHKLVDRYGVRETRARLLSAIGQYKPASDQFWSLLNLNPDNHLYIRGLIACAIRESQPDRAVNGSPTHPEPHRLPINYQHHTQFNMRKLANLQRRTLGPLPSIVTEDDVRCALNVCNQITKSFQFSRASQRIALEVIHSGSHPEFRPRIDFYVRSFLRKGVPSLFSDIQPLYDDPTKASVFGELFDSYRENLENKDIGKLPRCIPFPDDCELNSIFPVSDEEPEEEASCTLLWVLHFLAQHYDRLGQREKALEMIESAMSHSKTAIECYTVKADILKNCGDLKGAVKVADECRNLDLADRYLNTTCSEHALLADMIKEAEAWVGLFTRDGDSSGVQALYDMQCMWFELGAAESHLRRNQLPQALKKFTAVERHFGDMVEDQFDFHSYCLRKVTLRAYVNFLRFEDEIRSHPYFTRAAIGLLTCLLRLYDMPEGQRAVTAGEHSDIKGYAEMTESERKKAISKRKKQLARQRLQQSHGIGKGSGASGKSVGKGAGKMGGKSAGKKASSKVNANGTDKKQETADNGKSHNSSSGEGKTKGNPGWMETDIDGIEYVKELFKSDKNEDPILREATKIMRQMQEHLADVMDTHVLSFELALRRRKYLQALRSVKRAQKLDPEHPKSLLLAVKLSHELSRKGVKESFSDVVRSVFESEGRLLSGKSETDFVADYLKRTPGFAEHRVGAGTATVWLATNGVADAGSVEDACSAICKAIEESDGQGTGEGVLSPSSCRQLLIDLEQLGVSTELRAKIASSIRKKHPRASFV